MPVPMIQRTFTIRSFENYIKKEFNTIMGDVTKRRTSESFLVPVESMILYLPATNPIRRITKSIATWLNMVMNSMLRPPKSY
jgi:hypothetical protein